jgi:hypothetical protein
MAWRLATSARNAAADAIGTLVDAGPAAGTLKIYTGTQPATPNTAATGTLLATVTLVDPAFGAAATGVKTLADPPAATGVGDGTAGWFRIADSTGAAVVDGAVGSELTLSTNTISIGVTVDITGGTMTMPVG